MKAKVTFFPKNIITENSFQRQKPGFDMLHHILLFAFAFWRS